MSDERFRIKEAPVRETRSRGRNSSGIKAYSSRVGFKSFLVQLIFVAWTLMCLGFSMLSITTSVLDGDLSGSTVLVGGILCPGVAWVIIGLPTLLLSISLAKD